MKSITDFLVGLIPKSWLENTKDLLDKINSYIDYIIKPVYFFLIYFIYASYLAILLGTYFINPDFLHIASRVLEFFVCLFLIIRFNPLRKAGMTAFDQKLIFVSGIILLTNVGITSYFLSFLDKYAPASVIIDKINPSIKKTPDSLGFHENNTSNEINKTLFRPLMM